VATFFNYLLRSPPPPPRKPPPPVELFFTFVRHFSNQSSRSSFFTSRRTERYTRHHTPAKLCVPLTLHMYSQILCTGHPELLTSSNFDFHATHCPNSSFCTALRMWYWFRASVREEMCAKHTTLAGIEPATSRLQLQCSSTWAIPLPRCLYIR